MCTASKIRIHVQVQDFIGEEAAEEKVETKKADTGTGSETKKEGEGANKAVAETAQSAKQTAGNGGKQAKGEGKKASKKAQAMASEA